MHAGRIATLLASVLTQSLVLTPCMQGEVLELLKGAGQALQLVVIAGGLRSPPVPRDHHSRAELRYRKAKAFHNKVGSLCRYFLPYEGVCGGGGCSVLGLRWEGGEHR